MFEEDFDFEITSAPKGIKYYSSNYNNSWGWDTGTSAHSNQGLTFDRVKAMGYSDCLGKFSKLAELLEPILDCGLLDECAPETVRQLTILVKDIQDEQSKH